MTTVSSKDFVATTSKRLANFKLSDAAIKDLADRVLVNGLTIGKFDPCIYGICIDYFTDKMPELSNLSLQRGVAKWEVFPYGVSIGTVSTYKSLLMSMNSRARSRPVDLAAEARRADMPVLRSGFLPDRIIDLHPTRLCNLACLHCYSDSDSRQKATLDPDVLCGTLALLRIEGYAVVSLSGGEPLAYPRLGEIVERSQELGFRVTMVTNGLLATERMDPILTRLDSIAISFDGLAASHNAIRGRPDAFKRACVALERLAATGRPVAAAISLTREAIPELPDLADHLVKLGARALQIRPVARAGRARELASNTFYSAGDCARLYLVTLALQQELPSEVRVHCDLAPAHGLWQQREAYSGLLDHYETHPEDRSLSSLVNPLVITETGRLKPIAYDFDGHFDVATLDDLSPPRLISYKRTRLPSLQALVHNALMGLKGRYELVDWFDLCTRLSETRSWEVA